MNTVINSFDVDFANILTTNFEHHCVYRPLYERKMKFNIVNAYSKLSTMGYDIDSLKNKTDNNTRLVIMNHGSNVTGDVFDVSQVGDYLGQRKVPFAVDISQTAGAFNISTESELNNRYEWEMELVRYFTKR